MCLMLVMLALVSRAEISFNNANSDEVLPIKEKTIKDRKPIFRSVRELRRYLQQLDEWLAITGRPR